MAQEDKACENSLYLAPWLRDLLKEAIIYESFLKDLIATAHEVEKKWKDMNAQDKREFYKSLADFWNIVPDGNIYYQISKDIKDSIVTMRVASNLAELRTGIMGLIKIQDQLSTVEEMFDSSLLLQVKNKISETSKDE